MDIKEELIDEDRAFWDTSHTLAGLDESAIDPMLGLVPNSSVATGSDCGVASCGQEQGALGNRLAGVPMPTETILPPDVAVSGQYSHAVPPPSSGTSSTKSETVVLSEPPERNPSLLASENGKKKRTSKPTAHRERTRQNNRRNTISEQRRLSEASTHEEESGIDDEGDARTQREEREEHLRRNRIAASKCRKKQKVWVGQLEEHKVELEQQNTTLQMQYKGLVEQVHTMKNRVMAHAGCNDSNIDRWIEHEAKKVVAKSWGPWDQQISMEEATKFDQQQCGQIQEATPSGSSSSRTACAEINYDHMPDDLFMPES